MGTNKKGKLIYVVVGIALVLLPTLYLFKVSQQNNTQEPNIDNKVKLINDGMERNTPKIYNSVAYISNNNSSYCDDDETFLLDLDKNISTQIDVSSIKNRNNNDCNFTLYNRPNGRWVIFALNNDIAIYDKLSKDFSFLGLENHSKTIALWVSSSNSILLSPDGNSFVFESSYYNIENCIDICEEVDLYPTKKNGYFSYNIITKEKTYLGRFIIPSNWSSSNDTIYIDSGNKYHEYDLENHAFAINTSTGESDILKDMNSEGLPYFFSVHYSDIFKTHIFSIEDTANYNSILYIQKGNIKKEIDRSEFADIQTNRMIFPPNQAFATYVREHNNIDGIDYHKIMLIDINKMSKSELLIPSNNESFEPIVWINNEELLYTKITRKEESTQQNLYKINIIDLETTQLTQLENALSIY